MFQLRFSATEIPKWAAKYDYRFEYGHGFHSHRHGRAIFPDTLRWLWRDYPKTGVVGSQ